jgi:hypothetical protein
MNWLGLLRLLAAGLKYGAIVCGTAVSIHALKEKTWDEQKTKLTDAGMKRMRLLVVAAAVALLGAISQDVADRLQKNRDEASQRAQLESALEKGDAKVVKHLQDFNQDNVAPQFNRMLQRQNKAAEALEGNVETAARELRISQTPVDEIVLSLV